MPVIKRFEIAALADMEIDLRCLDMHNRTAIVSFGDRKNLASVYIFDQQGESRVCRGWRSRSTDCTCFGITAKHKMTLQKQGDLIVPTYKPSPPSLPPPPNAKPEWPSIYSTCFPPSFLPLPPSPDHHRTEDFRFRHAQEKSVILKLLLFFFF